MIAGYRRPTFPFCRVRCNMVSSKLELVTIKLSQDFTPLTMSVSKLLSR